MSVDNARLITLVSGTLFILLSLALWSLMRVPQHAVSVRLWTAGALMLGLGFLLSSFRAALPDWFGGLLLNSLALGSQWLRVLALRRHMDLPLRVLPGLVLLLLTMAAMAALSLGDDPRPRVTLACTVLAALSLSLAWHARLAGRRSGSRSARLLAISECPLAAMLLVRGVLVWLTLPPLVARPVQVGTDWLLLLAVVVVAAIYSNLTYMGLLLDDTRHDQVQAHEVQAAESRARQVAEAHAQALETLLQQRDRLAQERQRTLDLLAHEIRQPLHDAGGALQAAAAALDDLPPALSERAQQRLQRAQAVLGGVQSVLDNTLAAAALLARQTPLRAHEVDLHFLVDLVVGDLGSEQRARLRVDWQTDLRAVDVEPGLMRLALRNLLANAQRHGGPGVRVVLCIAEQAAPPALLLQVQDDGPGMPPERIAAVAEAGRDTAAAQMGGGLGLVVTRQVAQRHGGRLELRNRQPHGLRASLVLPLPG